MKCIIIAVPLMAVIWIMLVVIIIAPAQIASRISREEEKEEILQLCAKVSKTEDSTQLCSIYSCVESEEKNDKYI